MSITTNSVFDILLAKGGGGSAPYKAGVPSVKMKFANHPLNTASEMKTMTTKHCKLTWEKDSF